MKRVSLAVCIMAIVAATVAYAEEMSKDERAVRDVLDTEMAGWHENDTDKILSVYTKDFIGYDVDVTDPQTWTVLTNYQEFSDYLESQAAESTETEIPPGYISNSEVRSVNVKGDRAVSTTLHWYGMPGSVMWHRSAWILKKEGRDWKITSFVRGIDRGYGMETMEASRIRRKLDLAYNAVLQGEAGPFMESCCDDVILITSYDPEAKQISRSGSDDIKTWVDGYIQNNTERFASHDNWNRDVEVIHVDVNGDKALAVMKYRWYMPCSESRQTIAGSNRALITLEQASTDWKIKSITLLDDDNRVTQWGPE